jgi:hypothetical protein
VRILTKDNASAEQIVREMEARGYELTNVDTCGAHDIGAREFLDMLKKEKRAKRWRGFWWLIRFVFILVVLYAIT